MKSAIAVDLEGTLTTGGLWNGINHYLINNKRYIYYLLYKWINQPSDWLSNKGWTSRDAFKVHLIKTMPIMFMGLNAGQIINFSSWVVENELWPKRRKELISELLKISGSDEKKIVLVSGTYEPILRAFALKISEKIDVLGTNIEINKNGRTSGMISGVPNLGKNKVASLVRYLKDNNLYLETAYGDTIADLDMLMLSKSPIAAYPTHELKNLATEKGWKIFD